VLVLVLGGSRSGKSEFAERLVLALGGAVTYVATARPPDPSVDPDFAERVAAHRRRRPAGWTTLEVGPDLPDALAGVVGTALVDSLGTWVAGHEQFAPDLDALRQVLGARRDHTVVVSDEVGLGVHPSSSVGRRFRDALGLANRALAATADHVVFVAAGHALRLDPSDAVLAAIVASAGSSR